MQRFQNLTKALSFIWWMTWAIWWLFIDMVDGWVANLIGDAEGNQWNDPDDKLDDSTIFAFLVNQSVIIIIVPEPLYARVSADSLSTKT